MAKARYGVKGRYQDFITLFESMVAIREFEMRVMQLYNEGEIRGAVHPSVGQEAVAVGVASVLEEGDYLASTHRGHGHAVAMGASLNELMAELMGRVTGTCRGRGGSMHVADFGAGMLGANGIVGASIEFAVGAALSLQVQETRGVAVGMFGDGATSSGPLYEALNLAALWQLPLILVCENNQYSVTLPINRGLAAGSVAGLGEPFGVVGEGVDGMDLRAVIDATQDAVHEAREGGGPRLIEAKTYRFLGHSRGDPAHGPYRSKEDVESWRARDPVETFPQLEGWSKDLVSDVHQKISESIDAAVEYGRTSDLPNPADLEAYVIPAQPSA